MSSFAAWGLTILGLATALTVAEMLLPKGRLRNVIRSVFATVTALAMVTPLPALLKNGINFDLSADAVQMDDAYLQYTDEVKSGLLARAAERYLADRGIKGVTVRVESDGFNVRSASVKFDDTVMSENVGHINKSEIKKLIADYFDIGEEAVMTYG